MRLFFVRIAGLVVATAALVRLAGAQDIQLVNDFDMLPMAGLPQPGDGGNSWGLQTVDAPPSVALPPPDGVPPTCPPVYGAPIDAVPHAWVPGRYMGRGIEYCREFCGGADEWCAPSLDASPTINILGFSGYDNFRQIPDGNISESGIVQGANMGMPVPWLDALGIGFQAGASYGAYNLGGSPARTIPTTHVSQQVFITTGFFRRATADLPWSFGLVYDFMAGDHLGTLSQNYTLGQGRVEVAWNFTARNSWGMNASFDCQHANPIVAGTPVNFRPVSQGNLFWRHRFLWRNAESRFWGGPTDALRDNGDNSLGKIVFGLAFNIPVNDRWNFYVQGLSWDTTTAGVSRRDVYDFSVGLTFYPQSTGLSSTIAGRQWMPYMPVANNQNFLTDTDSITP